MEKKIVNFKSINFDKYKVVAFDIDGTLYNARYMNIALLISFLKHPRLSIAMKKFRNMERKMEIFEENYYLREATFFKNYFNLDSLDKAKLLINRLTKSQQNSFIRHIRPCKGLKESFAFLKENNKKIFLLSDFPVEGKPDILGISEYIDGAYFTGDSNRLKPDPKAFDYLLKQADCTKDEIIYIGDSYHKDIAGAKNVGIDSLLFTKKRSKHKSFSSYKE